MKRLTIIAAILLCFAGNVHAHLFYDMYNTGVRRPHFGIRVGGGYSYPYNIRYARTELSTRASGFDAAVSGLFHGPMPRGFYLEPQFELYFNSLKTAGTLSEQVVNEGITEATLKTVGIRVPIALGWSKRIDRFWKFYIYTGPEFDFRLKTWFKPDHPTKIFDSTTSRPLYGDYGVDLGLRSGLGFSFGRIYIGAYYTWKLCDIAKSDYGAKRQRVAAISLGYNFKNL
ncbi:MAG: PorT family protein [Paramuribaculum sp.]|nr:PorT family protein [Paramuribaculum sp.]MDE6459622.1 PorT family protein [Paramuribaculum sp.]